MTLSRTIWLVGLVCMLAAIPASAACTGSGTNFSCAAGSTSSDVQSAINSAADGATITFAAGSYTWSSWIHISLTKGVTLICSTPGACVVNAPSTIFGTDVGSGTSPGLYRFSGFTVQNNSSSYPIWFDCTYPGGSCFFPQIRIDHNTFLNMPTGQFIIFFGSGSTIGNYYGVVDHNTVNNATEVAIMAMIGAINPSPPASPQGTANNMFIEDNTISITTNLNASDGGCTDAWGGAQLVIRHNTSTNCLWTTHGVLHAGGPQNVEFYNNNITMNAGSVPAGVADCYRCFHHQGSGEFMAFNNVFTAFTGKSGDSLSMAHYRSSPPNVSGAATPNPGQCDGTHVSSPWIDGNRTGQHGYPCYRQPGRDFAGNLRPMYNWNNYWSDTHGLIVMNVDAFGGSPDYFSDHMVANRDWYNAVSASSQTGPTTPFNGTTGMGFGTLANRPTTCTTNSSESGGGVGYFATDQGSQGTLYRCSATNAWTVHYTPYTYPHPLQAGGGGGGGTSVIPPTIISATIQ